MRNFVFYYHTYTVSDPSNRGTLGRGQSRKTDQNKDSSCDSGFTEYKLGQRMPSKFPSYDTLRAKKDGKYMAELSLLTEVTDDREMNPEGLPTTCDSEAKTDDSVFTDSLSGGERLSSTHEVDVTEDSGKKSLCFVHCVFTLLDRNLGLLKIPYAFPEKIPKIPKSRSI